MPAQLCKCISYEQSKNFILAANFTSTKVLYNTRPLLSEFAKKIGKFEHPKRLLWLTDTYEDNNGVSKVLQLMHKEIRDNDLPIDILACSNDLSSEENLIVRKPLAEFTPPFYHEQPVRVPNFLDIHRIFLEGEYDRIICSTEGPMGLVALYLKHAYSVPVYHYIHTDWIMFARKVLQFGQENMSRLRRIMRAYYRSFDGLFVLNKDQQKWFSSKSIGIPKDKIFRTAHWVEEGFKPQKTSKQDVFGVSDNCNVVLFAGRISQEKGVFELVDFYKKVKSKIPNVHLVFAGSGPAQEELKERIEDASFLGWIDHKELPKYYSAADLLVLPSKFDTFSLVVLEAMSCGLPVISYKTKGPKDIIKDGETGYLVGNKKDFQNKAIQYLQDSDLQKSFKKAAIKRSKKYDSDKIIDKLLENIGLVG